MSIKKREKLSSQLPPTNVTSSMRQQILSIAVRENVSVNTIVREALQNFLREYESKTLEIESKSEVPK